MKRIAATIGLGSTLALCAAALASVALSGTYTATVGRGPLGGKVAGTWGIAFSAPKYTITYNGSAVANGGYTLSGNKVTFTDKSGKAACPGKGVYTYTLRVRSLTFKVLSDPSAKCAGRRAVLASTFTKKLSVPSHSGY